MENNNLELDEMNESSILNDEPILKNVGEMADIIKSRM